MKTLSVHYSFIIKLNQMDYIKVVLELRDGCLESNCELKTVQIILSAIFRASTSTNNY